MAHRKNTQRETVRDDPEETTLDPSGNLLALANPDGSPLTNGNLTDRYQYCWVQKHNANQLARYQGLAFAPVKRGEDEVRPKFMMFTEYEEEDDPSAGSRYIERADVWLMKRPIKYWHAEQTRTRARTKERAEQMNQIPGSDQRAARSAGAVIKRDMEMEPDFTFGA